MRQHPLIIGAGPAGAAVAITLAKAGREPIIIERATGPTDKVCGDFLSIDTIEQLHTLGIDPLALGATAISCIRLIHGDCVTEAALPFPAMGLSRRVLDHALLLEAERAGAILRLGQTVRCLRRSGPDWAVSTADRGALSAGTVFLATGKHDLRDAPRQHTKGDAIGMKMYFTLAAAAAKTLDGTVELTLFPGGYAGMQTVEQGRAVLCIAVQQHAFHAYGANWLGLLGTIQRTSRRFAAMLSNAHALLPRPLAIAAIPYGYRAGATASDGFYRVGDQAAVIPSLTGDGMGIALHSGQTAAETWLDGNSPADYHQVLTSTLRPQMRLAGLLHHACISGSSQALAARVAGRFPNLLRYAADHTRVRTHRRGRP